MAVNKTRDGRVLNWNPQLPDLRDLKYNRKFTKFLPRKLSLPAKVDLRNVDSPIFDQGQEGSCTANASAGMADFLEIKKGLSANPHLNPEEYISGKFTPASRAFVYWCERAFMGDTGEDNGAYVRTSAQVFSQKGACSEPTWPYGPDTLYPEPPTAAWAEAAGHKIVSYQALQTTTDMLDCLASGYPFIFGVTLYGSFESQYTAETGVVTIPSMFESPIGGHALCAVGYDQKEEIFIVRNSWGTGWGDNGYCYFPFAYLANQDLASDFWTFR